ncbi:MAG: hypothetical protein KTR16_14545 [Acidiferrobacterales bacterium]|nr:hypothetical protein [Acidiferrobacterales bacterium]
MQSEATLRLRLLLGTTFIIAILIIATGWLDKKGVDHTQAGLQRALVTFGVSRALNGVISVAQGTEVAVEPVGVGMTFTPGQILDPVNDLIERFSTVVLVAGTAFGAQHVLLDATTSTMFTWVSLTLSGLALLVVLLWNQTPPFIRAWVLRMSLSLVFLRLAVPVFAVGGEFFYQQFLEPQFERSSQELSQAAETLSLLNEESAGGVKDKLNEKSLLDSAKEWVQGAGSVLDWRAHLAEFSTAAERITEHAIKLIVVFVFQTLLLPILAVWLTLKGCKWCWLSQGLNQNKEGIRPA